MSRSGKISLAIVKIAGSEIISASICTSFNSLKYLYAASKSSLCASMLDVIYTFTPCSWANFTPSFKSSIEKFFAFALRENTSPPTYTASAPYVTATFNTSRLLAGISNSTFLLYSIIVSSSSLQHHLPKE